MTKKSASPVAAAAKKPLAKTVAEIPAPAPQVERSPAALQIELIDKRTQLGAQALCWFNPDTDPRLDVADARAAVRASTGSWPTVLRLSLQVFEDLCNHPLVIPYLATAQLQHSYDCMRGHNAPGFLRHYFGVHKLEVSEDESTASLA